jgi:plasmid stability protein
LTTEAITVQVPRTLYARLEERARQTHRSMEAELVEALAEALAVADDPLPAEVEDVLASLDTVPDDVLVQLACTSRLSMPAAAHLEEPNQKRQREGLTADEQQMVDALVQAYDRAMLVRAEAMARLKERGQDITALLEPVTA